MRVPLVIALFAVLMPGQGMAQRQINIPGGASLPNLRPCIDYAGEGWLKMTGERTPDPSPDAIVDHPTYHFRFTQRRALLGPSAPEPLNLYQAGHSLRRVDVKDALVFVQRATDKGKSFIGWEWIWTDRRGRKFIPVFEWPDGHSPDDWKPLAFRRFVKRVAYTDPQPYWPDIGWSDHRALDDTLVEADFAREDRLFDKRGHRYSVR